MIKLYLYTQEEVLWPIAFNKEAELQKAAETSPEHIFFFIDHVAVIRVLTKDGKTYEEIARDHLNMSVKDLRAIVKKLLVGV